MKKWKSVYWIYILLVVALCFVPFITDNDYYHKLFNRSLINIIVVLGLNFITGLTGQMNLGMAGIFALGAYTSALLTTKLAVSPWIGLLAAVFMGVIIGLMLGWPSLKVKGIYLALTTIGFGEIVRLVLTNAASFTGGPQGVLNIPSYSFFGIDLSKDSELYYMLLAITILAVIIAVRVINSRWGRSFKAIRDNDTAVEACGINVANIKITAFVLSAVFTSVAGALYAHLYGYINPSDFNFVMSVRFIMMLMFGGVGSVPGNIIGGTVITLLPEFLRFLQDYYWLIFSVIVFLCVMFLPDGVVSLFKFKKRPKAAGSVKDGE
ncbi:MAG: branched-chain amino acid ABC transporter permease [Christensenellales bacterium]|jgi:branched-chain amino acid transport system permease protein